MTISIIKKLNFQLYARNTDKAARYVLLPAQINSQTDMVINVHAPNGDFPSSLSELFLDLTEVPNW